MNTIDQKTIDDEEARTTAIGLYHFAHSYAAAAISLASTDVKSTHPDGPIRFLFRHSIELYLKAFLRRNGVSVRELRSRALGHSTIALLQRSTAFGFKVSEEQAQQIEWLDDAEIDRYLRTGFRSVLPHAIMEGVVKCLNEVIGGPIYEEEGFRRALPTL